ncbi:MAG: EamA family transporter [Oscillibacter sp.]
MNRSRSGYFYIVLCTVIFSTMEVMLKTVHGVFAPMQITCLRFLVGGILLIPFASRSIKKKNASLSRKDIGFFALSGFLCVVIAMSLYQMSVTYTARVSRGGHLLLQSDLRHGVRPSLPA